MSVWLVGAGPGDPGLLTRRGAQALSRAQVVVYDRLAAPELLDLAPVGAQRIYVGKGPGDAAMTQDEINAVLVKFGIAGLEVVRLKGGDPFVFGRGGEEAEALIAAGIEFEVVPGVTSSIAAAAYAGIPVTHRGISTHFTVVTGHEDPAKDASTVNWKALASTGGTLVILMGVGNRASIAQSLIEGGLAPSTPVAIVEEGTRPVQRSIRTTLDGLGSADAKNPAVIIVGDVAAMNLAWFEWRPLRGRSVVVTRAREQASELSARLELLGAEVIELPTISIEPVEFTIPDLAGFSWLLFTSANGVEFFFDAGLASTGRDTRALAGLRIAAIGPGTASALKERGVLVDLLPDRFVAEGMIEAFPVASGSERVLIACAQSTRDVLAAGLISKGFEVELLPVYRTIAAAPSADVMARYRSGVDAIIFTSSSTVTNFLDLVGIDDTSKAIVACIGPITADTARERGLRVDVTAAEPTIDGLVDAVVKTLSA